VKELVGRVSEESFSAQKSAYLVGIQYSQSPISEIEEGLQELTNLTETAGLCVKGKTIVKLKKPNPGYLIGKGKTEEIAGVARDIGVDCIVFNDDLSPAQQRNWEQLADICVIDRTEVILEIFANRAATREAVLQVELARMEYSLPRLKRAWTHLSRQKGGTRGTRGEGETQLEMDRRVVLEKIERIKRELQRVKSHRATQRKRRRRQTVPTASIVGYTNTGKSSLLNRLTGSGVYVENKLFATLDPTTRSLRLKNGVDLLLTDTVGFIRNLPHDLVDAFKSTLEETVLSDYLIHVLDASDPRASEHFTITMSVLRELDAADKPMVTVFNKIDLCENPIDLTILKNLYPDAIFVSAKTGEGMDGLVDKLSTLIDKSLKTDSFSFPQARYDLVALVYRTGRVIERSYFDNHIKLFARVPEKTRNLLLKYLSS